MRLVLTDAVSRSVGNLLLAKETAAWAEVEEQLGRVVVAPRNLSPSQLNMHLKL